MKFMNCREESCGTPIAFLVTKKGKRIPVDAESLSEDDILSLETGLPVEFRYGEHVSHFSTCPAAKDFRRTNGK